MLEMGDYSILTKKMGSEVGTSLQLCLLLNSGLQQYVTLRLEVVRQAHAARNSGRAFRFPNRGLRKTASQSHAEA